MRVRLEKDGARTVLADSFEGKRFNGPNDIAIAANGAIYFTDSDVGLQASEAVQMLDDYQIRQILLLASEDALFRYRLSQDVDVATRQRGYCLSPSGVAALSQVEFQQTAASGIEKSYRLLN